jgi:RNA polymerase sigma factor (sigma-70 family)
MKSRNTTPLQLNELTERFPKVSNRAASAARLLLGNGREQLVEEVVNDVLLLLWRRFREGNPPENPEAWAHKVAWNRAAKVARMEGRYVTGLVEQCDDQGLDCLLMPPNETTPASDAELADRLSALERLLDAFDTAARTQLNDKEAVLFELVYRKRLTSEEVAFELCLNPQALRKQWSRLLQKLLESVRLDLQHDPLCNDLLGAVLDNEKTCHRTLLQVLRLAMRKGADELERLVKSAFDR